MGTLTQTLPGAPGGMNKALPAQELDDTEAQYIQDAFVDYPGLVRRRGPVRAASGLVALPRKGSGLVMTLNPLGKDRYAILTGDASNGYVTVLASDLLSSVDLTWPHPLPTDPAGSSATRFRIVDAKAALMGGAWVGASSAYDSDSPNQGLALWFGGNKANYTTGTLTVARGSAAVTGAGTAWLANVVPGMFLFANTDEPYSNTLIGTVKSVNTDTTLTLTKVSPYAVTAKAYTAQSIRGFAPRVATGRITADTGSTTVSGGNTKFNTQGLSSGTWQIYRASDLTFIGKVASVQSEISLTLAANAAIAVADEPYLALRADADWSIETTANVNKVGFLSATYAERQWYANNGSQYDKTHRLWFSDPADVEAVDLSEDGDWIPVSSTGDVQEPVRALAPAYNALLVLKENESFAVTGASPSTFSVKKIEDDGVLSGMSVQLYGGGVIWAGRDGIYYYDGIQPTNMTQPSLGDVWKNSIQSFDPSRYRMWSMVSRNHYFVFIEDLDPTISVVKGNTSATPTRWGVVINMVTRAVTMVTNVHLRGAITLPASTGERVWYLVNNDLSTPTSLVATPSSSGGSLSTATYYYKVVALDSVGTTVGSSEVSAVVTGPTGSVALSWAAVVGASSYRVYRGTSAGGQDTYYTTTSNSMIDTGAAGTAGTVPGSNTANIAVICSADDLFDAEGADGFGPDDSAIGPDFYFESKKFDAGDSLRLKRFKQLAIHYLVQGAAMKLDTVTGLNNVGKLMTTDFPATVPTWSTLRTTISSWTAMKAQYPTWSSVVQSVFRPKRIRFLKRSQHMSFRLYQASSSVARLKIGPYQLGYKLMRPGRV